MLKLRVERFEENSLLVYLFCLDFEEVIFCITDRCSFTPPFT